MNKRNSGPTPGAAALAALITLAGAASAQVSAKGQPLDIAGDHSEYLANEHMAVVTGRVEVLQGQNRLRADVLKIWKRAVSTKGPAPADGILGGDIERIEASGNVYLVTPTQVIKGDKAVYTAADDTTVVTGKVVLTQGENVAVGRRLVLDNRSGRATLDGADGEQRIRFTLYPNKAKGQDPAGR